MKELQDEFYSHASTLIDEEERVVGCVNISIYLAYWTMSFRRLHVIVQLSFKYVGKLCKY